MSIVIKVENLSKQYRLGSVGTGSLKDDIKRWRYKMMRREDPFLTVGDTNDRTIKGGSEYIWALKDINFEVKQGEVLGIIGKNGAGKSTLLKILSRTTGPTTGSVKMKGRIASLLEVGTGFHGELSGRENIFLNGAIMGMSKTEIRKRFDEIVDFAGVEKYIDTPVKRYSSGMYVRLAFGVAAHLEPDIMIIDEVLAVGDAEFQKKALGKMKDVSEKDGRTVIFVSHQMGSVAQLCSTGICLEHGGILAKGDIDSIIAKYLSSGDVKASSSFINNQVSNQKEAIIASMNVVDKNNEDVDIITTNDKISIQIEVSVKTWIPGLELSISLQDKFNKRIFTVNKLLKEFMKEEPSFRKLNFSFPADFITPGSYSWLVSIHVPGNKLIDVHWEVCSFKIIDGGTEFARYENVDYGYVYMKDYEYKILQ